MNRRAGAAGQAGGPASAFAVREGSVVCGKWTGIRIQVERALGAGANGAVYLVRTPKGRAAMKVCPNSADLALEWGLISRLGPRISVFPKPMLADDEAHPPHRSFYVMEWIEGSPLQDLLRAAGPPEWARLMEAVACGLADVHRLGYAFCDVKPENILVTPDTATGSSAIRFVDVGGVTEFGRSVRQFTPYYDRAFWGLGTRRADPAYD
ncbi:MAG: phosphotransferase, partial [Alicyclobacillus sp.]|nr:phosphotransferase [Alicyclobacillus sp.]